MLKSIKGNHLIAQNSKTKQKGSILAIMTLDFDTMDDDSGIANSFNKYFYSVFTQSSPNQPSTVNSPTTIPPVSSIQILLYLKKFFNVFPLWMPVKLLG